MSILRELYQEVILDHSKNPRNFHKLDKANRRLEGYNPLCGDQLTLYLSVYGNEIEDASFEGHGCAISTASASLMTDLLKGKSIAEAETLFNQFHQMLTANGESSGLGKLEVLAGVKEFPIRVKCATLPWHTMKAALDNKHDIVTTEG